MSSFSFLHDGGRRGWWCAQDDGVKVTVGGDLSLLLQFGGHTTTQPSSIEEEGYMFQGFRFSREANAHDPKS
jgi:hypothetical protein